MGGRGATAGTGVEALNETIDLNPREPGGHAD
jgi:hypothetical protein